MQLQNGITIIPAKNDDELRRALFVTDQVSDDVEINALDSEIWKKKLFFL